MQPSQQSSRINLQELKAQMIKRIGPDKARKYFDYFKSYISTKLNKTQIDKQVILTIGKENIALHNQIIKAVLNNAMHAEVPPPALFVQDTSKSVNRNCEKRPVGTQIVDLRQRFLSSPDGNLSAKIEALETNRSIISKEKTNSIRYGAPDNDLNNVNVDRLSWRGHVSPEQPETNLDVASSRLGKRPRHIETSSLTDTDVDAESNVHLVDKSEAFHEGWTNQHFRPGIGVQSCSTNIYGTKKPGLAVAQLLLAKFVEADFLEPDELPDIEALQRYMDCMAVSEGLEVVNEDGVKVVHWALDAFLKQVIRNCINYVRSKSASQQGHKVQSQGSAAGFSHSRKENESNEAAYPDRSRHLRVVSKEETDYPTISLLDFKHAMDMKPQQLGESWPLQLERILLRSFE